MGEVRARITPWASGDTRLPRILKYSVDPETLNAPLDTRGN